MLLANHFVQEIQQKQVNPAERPAWRAVVDRKRCSGESRPVWF